MTEFLTILLAFTQIPILLVFGARRGLTGMFYHSLNKNPEWIDAHPDFRNHNRINSAALYFFYFLAAASLLATIKYSLITPSPDYYVRLLVTPQLIWGLGLSVYVAAFDYGVMKKIPAPAIRKASLIDRRLSAFVPLWTVQLCYGSLALEICIYAWALMNNSLDHGLAIRRILGVSGVVIIGTGVLLCFLRRKHSELEDILGLPSGRRVEVIFGLSALYLGVAVGAWRILGDFFGILLFRRCKALCGYQPVGSDPHVGSGIQPQSQVGASLDR